VPEGGLNLFVLAHPDDELAFAAILHRLASERKPVRLIYLADGQSRSAPPEVRSAESKAALAWLGIDQSSLWFAGSELGFADGTLHRHLPEALAAIERSVGRGTPVAAIYTLAWEGGHSDHDAAHVVVAAFAAARALLDSSWQAAFYRAADTLPPPAFVVSAPLAANGLVQRSLLTPAERRLPRRMMRFYPSQWRSFVGLGPSIIWHSLIRRSFALQPIRLERLSERPTPRPLLYERRNGIAFDDFFNASAPFLQSTAAARKHAAASATATVASA
jgi:LmbE family N-acetylglucosaminyl deacetylase